MMRSDGYMNLLNSLIIAGHFIIPEVLIVFNDKVLRFIKFFQLYRGNRSRKYDGNSLQAFTSPNFEPLATLGRNFDIKWNMILKP